MTSIVDLEKTALRAFEPPKKLSLSGLITMRF